MGEVRITDEMVERAIAAFDAACSEPLLVKCKRCDGKGYHHGFGEFGCDPDWCSDCGGGGVALAEGEEHRPLRAALSAALSGMAEPVAWRRMNEQRTQSTGVTDTTYYRDLWTREGSVVEPLYAAPPVSDLREENRWREMDSAPLDGKHCILAVKSGAFIYSVQGAYHGGQWDCAFGDNVKPLYWMPNVRLPEGWESKLAEIDALQTEGK